REALDGLSCTSAQTTSPRGPGCALVHPIINIAREALDMLSCNSAQTIAVRLWIGYRVAHRKLLPRGSGCAIVHLSRNIAARTSVGYCATQHNLLPPWSGGGYGASQFEQEGAPP
ncbi:unnamed protein product, partial [Ectocarpus sp. 4 AP-2014]